MTRAGQSEYLLLTGGFVAGATDRDEGRQCVETFAEFAGVVARAGSSEEITVKVAEPHAEGLA